MMCFYLNVELHGQRIKVLVCTATTVILYIHTYIHRCPIITLRMFQSQLIASSYGLQSLLATAVNIRVSALTLLSRPKSTQGSSVVRSVCRVYYTSDTNAVYCPLWKMRRNIRLAMFDSGSKSRPLEEVRTPTIPSVLAFKVSLHGSVLLALGLESKLTNTSFITIWREQ